MIKAFCNFLAFLSLFSFAQAQSLNPLHQWDWNLAGARLWDTTGTITLRFADLGGVGDGQTFNDTAWANIPDSLEGRPLRILFDTGDYRFAGSLALPDSLILEGKGAQSRLLFDPQGGGQSFLTIGGSGAGGFRPLNAMPQARQAWFLVADTTGFRPGRYAEIRQENGAWDSNPASWAQKAVGHVSKIVHVSGDTVFLEEGFRYASDSLLQPEARPLRMRTGVRIQCLKLERVDQPGAATGYHIRFSMAADCLVEGVESEKSLGSHIIADVSTHLTIRHNYIHDAYEFNGSGTRGYGVTINNHSTLCLVENNRFRRLRHAMMVKYGANGNVFGYNHSVEVLRAEPISDYSADISVHGHYPFANLFESNEVEMIMVDHYWGPGGPDNVFFRNRVNGFGVFVTNGTPVTDQQHFIGNEVTNGNVFYGQWSIQGQGHTIKGNNVLGTCTPPGTEQIPEASLYLSGAPPYWAPQQSFPSQGYPKELDVLDIPAAWRFAEGLGAVCSDAEATPPPSLGLSSVSGHWAPMPNPCSGALQLPGVSGRWALYNLMGQQVQAGHTATSLPQLGEEAPGVYIIETNQGRAKIIRP